MTIPTKLYRHRLPLCGSRVATFIYLALSVLYISLFVQTMNTAGNITGQTSLYIEKEFRDEVEFREQFQVLMKDKGQGCKGVQVQVVSQIEGEQGIRLQQVAKLDCREETDQRLSFKGIGSSTWSRYDTSGAHIDTHAGPLRLRVKTPGENSFDGVWIQVKANEADVRRVVHTGSKQVLFDQAKGAAPTRFLGHTKRQFEVFGPLPAYSDESDSSQPSSRQVLELAPVPPSQTFLALQADSKPLGRTSGFLLTCPTLVEPRIAVQITHLKQYAVAFTEATALVLVLHTLIMFLFLRDFIKNHWLSRAQLAPAGPGGSAAFVSGEEDTLSATKEANRELLKKIETEGVVRL